MGSPIDLIAPGRVRVGINPAVERIPADIYAGKNDTTGRLVVQVNGFGVSVDGPYVGIGHARGTSDAPTNNVDGDNLGDFEFYAYAGGWRQAAEMRAFVDGAVADGVTPSTHIEFKVTTGGALSTRATLFAGGRFALGSGSRASDTDQTANGAGTLWVAENASVNAIAAQFSGSNASPVQYLGRKSRGGSMSAPTAVVQDDGLVIFRPGAYTGAWFDDGAFMRFAVDAAVVANQRPAMRFEVYTNPNNSAPVAAFLITSTRAFRMGDSVTAYADSQFNLTCNSTTDTIHTTFGQNSGGGTNFKINFATYTGGYTNGAPATLYVIDNNFSCSLRFDLKLTGAAANAQGNALRLDSAANMPNAAFFAATGSYGNGQGVIFMGNRNTAPSANPVGGGVLYAEAGALKWRGSGGTTTTIANA